MWEISDMLCGHYQEGDGAEEGKQVVGLFKASDGRSRAPVALVALSFALLVLLSALVTAGCRGVRDGSQGASSGTEQKSLAFGSGTRTYLVHLPEGYDQARQYPLVLAFHGGTRNGASMERLTSFSPKADEEGFIVVYPDGTGRLPGILMWNVGFGFGYALGNDVDDVGFVRALVEKLEFDYSVDSSRIYATGISNGGMLSYLVASELSDVFAAVAPVAGAYGGREDEGAPLVVYPAPSEPVSLIIFNGRKDRMVPYNGGAGRGFSNAAYQPVSEAVGAWVAWNGCDPSPATTVTSNGNVRLDMYSRGRNGTEVVLYTIEDGGHAWPGGAPAWKDGDRPTSDVNATDLIWKFFEAHPKR